VFAYPTFRYRRPMEVLRRVCADLIAILHHRPPHTCTALAIGLNSPIRALSSFTSACIVSDTTIRVSYLELTRPPAPLEDSFRAERMAAEKLPIDEYLNLYRRVGGPLRWDQRLKMPRTELASLLASPRSQLYVLRDPQTQPIGFCEFERALPEIELKNFGLEPSAQGKGLGSFLLRTALREEWQSHPRRIWLHTDTWDHPTAIKLYESVGFQTYLVRDEPPGDL
jgi:ribosomal protein S18 acetylase RimI-like enzyme